MTDEYGATLKWPKKRPLGRSGKKDKKSSSQPSLPYSGGEQETNYYFRVAWVKLLCLSVTIEILGNSLTFHLAFAGILPFVS